MASLKQSKPAIRANPGQRLAAAIHTEARRKRSPLSTEQLAAMLAPRSFIRAVNGLPVANMLPAGERAPGRWLP